MIYADNAATTQMSEYVFEKMLPFVREEYGNPSSLYSLGVQSKRAVERSRKQVAHAIGSEASEIIFTSGGSEGNSWILLSIPTLFPSEKGHVITSAIEHHSILNVCRELEKQGVDVSCLPVDTNGRVSVSNVESALRPNTKLVSIMTANNEIGTLQPIEQIGELLHSRNVLFHTDAVQAVGHIPIQVNDWNVDFLTASAHKFHGAKGAGFLYVRKGNPIPHYIFGGGQEQGKRAGTENVAGIVALGYALEECVSMLNSEDQRLRLLVKATIEGMRARIPAIRMNAEHTLRLPGIVNITFPGVPGEALMHLLDMKGICVSTSSACNSGNDAPSHVLLALGVSEQEAKMSIRISYGRFNTMEEVQTIIDTFVNICKKF